MTNEAIGRAAYEAYCDPVPGACTPWDQLSKDHRAAWIAAAKAAIAKAFESMGEL
jgi:hypothetical protein